MLLMPTNAAAATTEERPRLPHKERSPWRDVPLSRWLDWRWQMRHRITETRELARLLGVDRDALGHVEQASARFAFGVTPYYASLIDPEDPDCPIRRMVVPAAEELLDGTYETADPLNEEGDAVAPGMTHRYPDRVLWTLTLECASFCRHCTRKRKVGEAVSLIRNGFLDPGLAYLRAHPEIRDVVLSGGDPLLLSDQRIEHVLERLRREAPSVEIIRFGTRLPVTLPQRITPALVSILRRYHPVYVNVHFNVPRELTPESEAALARLADAGIPLGNQSVLLRGVNDCPNLMKQLVYKLTANRVRPYYVYQCDLSPGLEHFRTTVRKGIEIVESLRGHVSGLAVPTFVVDAPGGGGKIPVGPNYVLSQHEHKVILRNYEGRIVSYEEPRHYESMCSNGNPCRHCRESARREEKPVGVAGLFDEDPEHVALIPEESCEPTETEREAARKRNGSQPAPEPRPLGSRREERIRTRTRVQPLPSQLPSAIPAPGEPGLGGDPSPANA